MNVRIVELIFMEKDEREFSLMSEAHEKIVFCMVRHSKNLFTVVYWTETRLFVLKEVLMKQVKITHVILNLLLMDVAVKIPINNCLSFFNFNLFICGHVYQHIWTRIVGEKYRCIWVIENKQDKNTIVVVHEERVVGHIPMAVSKYVNMFLSLLKILIRAYSLIIKKISRSLCIFS